MKLSKYILIFVSIFFNQCAISSDASEAQERVDKIPETTKNASQVNPAAVLGNR